MVSSKKKNKKKESAGEKISEFVLHPETKKSVIGTIFLAISLFFFLSGFGKAGILGRYTYKAFSYLFGIGFWFLPFLLLAAGIVFILSARLEKIYSTTLLGAALVFESLLSLTDIFNPKKGGIFGRLGGLGEKIFGFYGSLIVWSAFLLIGFLILFNLSFKKILSFRNKEEERELLEEKEEEVITKIKKQLSSDKEKEEEKTEEAKLKEEKSQEGSIFKKAAESIKENFSEPKVKKHFYRSDLLPPLSLLEKNSNKPKVGDLKNNANIIKRTLANFGIFVELAEINVGPTVTRYTFRPAEGTRLAKIMSLSGELSLALAAHPIRIEAPIPGKSLIGIEVPNKVISTVRLRELLEREEFQRSGPLVFPLGKDVAGIPFYADLAKMPHLLIAGATGSGKSITIHSLICSLLFKNSPSLLNLILIDPKKVELTLYQDLPHLITPTIIEPKKALGALGWLIKEMERRYDMFLESRVRDLAAFNDLKLQKGEEVEPYIVAVIDELADLMATYPREIEASIVRLAQMARATGIHLVVSTQRPSVEVITGLIKANITSRIALQVASQIDSRTILDMAGAEKLLGKGDMLYIDATLSKPKRIQGAYISTKEIKKVVDFWKKTAKKVEKTDEPFSQEENKGREFNLEEFLEKSADVEDPLYEEAYRLVVETQKASTSYLQRKLRIGYSRAARLLDLLEERGVVGPPRGSQPREVYVKKEDVEEV